MIPYACPVAQSAHRSPDAEALRCGERRWTYRQLHEEVTRAAAWLAAHGVRSGDRVAAIAWNRPEVVIALHAAARLGAVWVPLNARLAPAEHRALVDRIRPALTLVGPGFEAPLSHARSLSELGSATRQAPPPPDRPEDPAAVRAILFTSGTTGIPKGAELTFGNFDACARANAANLGGGSDQRWLGTLPLFHVGGLTMAHRCALYGATLVLHERFDAEAVARSLRDDAITHASLVATGLRWLLDHGEARAPETLRAVLIGGGPIPPELMARARQRGYPVLQTYGLTETCSQVATERPGAADGRTAGEALEGTELRVIDERGLPAGAGTPGEIEVRGPTVMRGYFEDPQATARVLRDGWLRTGDLGVLDARGRIQILTRRTDLIVSGGENIYPAEVEAVLSTHPAVAEVAVLGLEDETWGQIPAALVVPRRADAHETAGAPTRNLPPGEVLARYCRERLAGFKVPKRFIAVEALPKTANGKVDRGRLRALAAEKLAAAPARANEVQSVLNVVNAHDQRA